MKNSIHDKTSIFWEVVRFLVVGGVATLFDLGTKTLVAYCLPEGSLASWFHFGFPIVCGFIVGVLVNYALSVVWVFKNVDPNKNVRSQGNFWLFVGLGFGGLLLGLGIFYLSRYLIMLWSNNAIDIDIGKSNISLTSPVFWTYFAVFCFQTLVVLVYNYFTRKAFIFKKPEVVSGQDGPKKD